MRSEVEWKTRCELAALYRIFDILGWTDAIFTHISARIPGTNRILMNPYGYLYDEITASNLVMIDLDTDASDGKHNSVGYNIHSAIHQSKPEVQYIAHSHTTPIVSVSSISTGLIPCSQYSVYIMENLSYHEYEGIFFWDDEKSRLVESMGDASFCLMKNHGSLVLGRSVEMVLFNQYILQRACEIQLSVMSAGVDNVSIPKEVREKTVEFTVNNQRSSDRAPPLLWSAMKRKLDRTNPGYDR